MYFYVYYIKAEAGLGALCLGTLYMLQIYVSYFFVQCRKREHFLLIYCINSDSKQLSTQVHFETVITQNKSISPVCFEEIHGKERQSGDENSFLCNRGIRKLLFKRFKIHQKLYDTLNFTLFIKLTVTYFSYEKASVFYAKYQNSLIFDINSTCSYTLFCSIVI